MTRSNLLKPVEWIVAILLTAMTAALLAVAATHGGALWRDECAVVQLAQMPSVSDILRNFQHEAFPPLFPLIVRSYMLAFRSSDAALRIFGFVIGCSLVGAFWINARTLRRDLPLVGLALTVLNTTFFVWGTTVRGYGVGSALIVLTFGCIAGWLLNPNSRRVVIATVVSVFAVQILLYNSVLVCAICGAALLVLFFQRRFKQASLAIGICGIALFFLLPYVPSYLRARDWNILVRGWPTSYSLWKHFEVALGNPGYSIPALWYCIVLGLIGLFVLRLYQKRDAQTDESARLVWFALIACVLALIGCYAFLRILSYTTSNWYYLAFICVVAAAIDLIASVLSTSNGLRLLRVAVAIVALIVAPFANWSAITERHTDVDLAAKIVSERADANDLVLVAPWPFGIPFNRYYHGAARWMTIPNIQDHQVHRYDLIKSKMVSEHPIDDLSQTVTATLSSGNRVWFVGGLNLPSPREGAMTLPPAPASRFKWDNRAYTAAWWQQLSVLTVTHTDKIESVSLPQPGSLRVNELEQTSLAVAQGWH
ncbi:MAG TPA: hypothetical protein VNX27_02450 [Chthoniobacterales bacterium]|nr:hypothetical protein [Chthoniobacterales bacterium]